MPTITIPANNANMEGLILLASGLQKITGGGEIKVSQVIQIETENMPALWALEDLLKKDYMQALPVEPAYEVKACAIPALIGHHYTARTVENYIYLGKFPPGTKIYHPARGHLVVTADRKLVPEGEQQA